MANLRDDAARVPDDQLAPPPVVEGGRIHELSRRGAAAVAIARELFYELLEGPRYGPEHRAAYQRSNPDARH